MKDTHRVTARVESPGGEGDLTGLLLLVLAVALVLGLLHALMFLALPGKSLWGSVMSL